MKNKSKNMVTAIVRIIGVKVRGRILVNRSQLCEVLGYKPSTFSVKLSQKKIPPSAKIETESGEMWDLEKALSIKIRACTETT